jgi:microcystin-dependent protein
MVLGYGQTGTQSAYPNLYTIYGGTGGNFTFPDLRGRGVYGLDNMGGSAANRITTAGSGIDGTVPNNSCGAQNTSLATGNLPAHTHVNTLTDPGHTHTFSNPVYNNAPSGNVASVGGQFYVNTNTTINSATTGITINNASVGSGTAFGTMNPAFVCMYAIKT